MTSLALTISAPLAREHVPFLRRSIRASHKILVSNLSELSVALVNDRTMIALHDRFMNDATPTDVLTFSLDATSGEIVVCVPEARRQSKLRGTTLRNELLLYALHGMLHLAGFDDRTARDFKRIHREEDRILRAIGVGPVFNPNAAFE